MTALLTGIAIGIILGVVLSLTAALLLAYCPQHPRDQRREGGCEVVGGGRRVHAEADTSGMEHHHA